MDIKKKKKEKRIQLLGGLIGSCVAVASLFYFFHAEKEEAEKRMVEIVNYVKVQCSTYTHYNESSESKSLLRAIESARQMSTNIDMETENDGQLSQEFLKENLQTLWVDGIIVLDTEGKIDCEYSMDESLANEITAYLQKDIIMDFAGYEERSYSERFAREDGSYIDVAACARKDAPGIVAIYYSITSDSFILQMVHMADYYADDMEKQTEYRTKVKEASNLLLELVNEILDMSKLESGEIVLEEIPLIGVRISWLIRCRNSVFASLAASAFFAAIRSSALYFSLFSDV